MYIYIHLSFRKTLYQTLCLLFSREENNYLIKSRVQYVYIITYNTKTLEQYFLENITVTSTIISLNDNLYIYHVCNVNTKVLLLVSLTTYIQFRRNC